MNDLAVETLKALKTAWTEKRELAILRKKPYQDTVDQCMAFYSGGMGWMYEDRYRQKFLGADINPKFKICLLKAFEMVALYGPTLFYRNPVRNAQPHKRPEITVEIMAAGEGIDWQQAQQVQEEYAAMQQAGQAAPLEMQMQVFQLQQMQQRFTRMEQQDRLERTQLKAGCDVLESYLSYTPREQPGGGLMKASQRAVTEALIKGRGLLMPGPYRMPGSNRQLTGCFFKSVDHLLIDPDAESAEFGEAKWISLDYYDPTWEVERRYNLKPGSLKGNMESADAQGARKAHPLGNLERERGTTFDILRYTKIWSLGGVGTRLTGTSKELQRGFDDVVGDYAHIVIADEVEYPLNCETSRFKRANDQWVREAFSWPVAYWMDRRWPAAFLDFYDKPRSPWPMPPIAPGLGELTALNVLISAIVQRGWESSRRIRAVAKSAWDEVNRVLKSGGQDATIQLKDIHGDINKVIMEFDQKDMPFDTWRVVERLFELFDKRVGLTDLMYGMNAGGVASRTATDMKIKEERTSIRPDHMAQQVEAWQTEAGRMEKLCAYWNGVSGDDVRPILGTAGAQLWDQLFAGADPETIVREMDCTVEAQSVRKPNKEREVANVNQVYPAMQQSLDKHADVTGDTEPLNALNKKVGDAIEMDMEDLRMGPRTPPPQEPDPAIQMEAQLEQARMQVEIQLKQMDLQAKQMEMAGKQGEMEAQGALRQMELFQGQQEHSREIAQNEEQFEQSARHDEANFAREYRQDQQEFALDMQMQTAKAAADLAIARAKGQAAIAAAKAKAKATPKTQIKQVT